jgi:predicted dienelactone hydrolase
MLHTFIKTLCTSVILCTAPLAAQAQQIGMQDITFTAEHHGASPITGELCYPTLDTGPFDIVSQNKVFQGVEVLKNATLPEGKHPTILLSHGMGGGAKTMSWLAAQMAERGAIVISVNHINSYFMAFDPVKNWQHWTRAQDLSAALDHLLADDTIAPLIDLDHISAVGFSYGGWTALPLGGARLSLDGYLANCDAYGDVATPCARIIDNPQVITPKLWNASYRDPRVRAVVAIDPGAVWGLRADLLEDVPEATTLIALGNEQTQMSATDVDKSGLSALLPNARVERFEKAVHFTAMPLCTKIGRLILAATFDDSVCTDPKGTDRAQVHDQIATIVAQTIGL